MLNVFSSKWCPDHVTAGLLQTFIFFSCTFSDVHNPTKIKSISTLIFCHSCPLTAGIAHMAAVRHLEFFKYANFYFPNGLQWQPVCSCKISSRSVARLQRY